MAQSGPDGASPSRRTGAGRGSHDPALDATRGLPGSDGASPSRNHAKPFSGIMVLNRGMDVIQRIGKSACAAGKHVYVEKPCSHKPWERERSMKREAKHDDRAQTIGFQPGSYSRCQ